MGYKPAIKKGQPTNVVDFSLAVNRAAKTKGMAVSELDEALQEGGYLKVRKVAKQQRALRA